MTRAQERLVLLIWSALLAIGCAIGTVFFFRNRQWGFGAWWTMLMCASSALFLFVWRDP